MELRKDIQEYLIIKIKERIKPFVIRMPQDRANLLFDLITGGSAKELYRISGNDFPSAMTITYVAHGLSLKGQPYQIRAGLEIIVNSTNNK